MVIYVHPIENKVTIVRRDNKVTISHVGVQGERGPELMIQYSRDGVSGWHAVPTVDDNYLRFSSDEGRTWGSAVWFNTIDECHDYMIKSQAWAENPENIPVENDQYSALHHASKAAVSASNAATSETNALESASNAYASEMNAAASEDKAAKWAQEDEDVEVEPGKYSAFHYKEKALAAQIRAEYAAANAELVALGGIPI